MLKAKLFQFFAPKSALKPLFQSMFDIEKKFYLLLRSAGDLKSVA